jgi:uncharacterized protein YhaN
MPSLNQFLAILNTRRYTEEEWAELTTRLNAESTDTLKMLYCIAADKDHEVNDAAREEARHLEISRRWETLRHRIRSSYDHVALREKRFTGILSTEHELEYTYHSYKLMKNIFHPPPPPPSVAPPQPPNPGS